MTSPFQRLAVLVILWLPFSGAGIAAIVVTFAVILFANQAEQQGYGKNVLRAMDKVLAAVCGFSGYYTFSAECGVATARPWTWIRWLLDKIQPGHCEGAAVNEKLTAPD
jgi:hypothetical protein